MTRPHERTRALRWAGDLLHELREAPGTTQELVDRIDLIMRHYPSEIVLRFQARADATSCGPFLLPEPEGSPARPDDVVDPQGMATWQTKDGGGALYVECSSGLRFSVQSQARELSDRLAGMHDQIIVASDLVKVEPWLRKLEFKKTPARPPEMALWRAIGLNTTITLLGLPGPAGGAYAALDKWQDFLDGH